jgi:hypothetical protein
MIVAPVNAMVSAATDAAKHDAQVIAKKKTAIRRVAASVTFIIVVLFADTKPG